MDTQRSKYINKVLKLVFLNIPLHKLTSSIVETVRWIRVDIARHRNGKSEHDDIVTDVDEVWFKIKGFVIVKALCDFLESNVKTRKRETV